MVGRVHGEHSGHSHHAHHVGADRVGRFRSKDGDGDNVIGDKQAFLEEYIATGGNNVRGGRHRREVRRGRDFNGDGVVGNGHNVAAQTAASLGVNLEASMQAGRMVYNNEPACGPVPVYAGYCANVGYSVGSYCATPFHNAGNFCGNNFFGNACHSAGNFFSAGCVGAGHCFDFAASFCRKAVSFCTFGLL